LDVNSAGASTGNLTSNPELENSQNPEREFRRDQYDGFSGGFRGADECPPTRQELVRFAMLC